MKSKVLSPFGTFLAERKCEPKTAALALGITSSYVSMLSRGVTKPGLKLALRIETWTAEAFGEAFAVGRWA